MAIANEDSIRDRYDRMLSRLHVPADADRCVICGDEEYDMIETDKFGFLCSACNHRCCFCGDYMVGEETVTDSQGNEAHKICAEDEVNSKEAA